jgi:uncharacterized protein YndB with AHSA1/START domain
MSENSLSASRVIDAPADAVFEVLSLPANHPKIDGSGFVVSGGDQRIQEVGQVFVMEMNGEHMGGDYVMENTVSGYDENKLLAWRPKPQGGDLEGWEWIWELEPQGPDSTKVTQTYSWADVSEEVKQQVSFPLVKQEALDSSLNNLAAAVSGK